MDTDLDMSLNCLMDLDKSNKLSDGLVVYKRLLIDDSWICKLIFGELGNLISSFYVMIVTGFNLTYEIRFPRSYI